MSSKWAPVPRAVPAVRHWLPLALIVVCTGLVLAACGSGDDDAATVNSTEVRPFSEVQATEFAFEPDPFDPRSGIFRVETTEPMICAIVWGETDRLGRLNNSMAMDGTGIIDHDVALPDIEPGRPYHFVVQGTTADGTLYRSEPATFTIPEVDAAVPSSASPEANSGENLALGATVVDVSSEFSAGFAAEHAVDGDLATEWSTSADGDDGSITIDLGAELDIGGIEFVTRSMADGTAITSTFTVRVDDGDPLGPFPAASLAERRVAPLDVSGRIVRLDVDQSSGGNVGAAEIRILAAG